MNNKTIIIPNSWYDIKNGKSFISQIGRKSFAMWVILQSIRLDFNESNLIPIQIKSIFNEYCFLTGFGKPANIKNHLIDLKSNGLIECEELNKKTKPSDLLYVRLVDINLDGGFQKISYDLFKDKIRLLNTVGLFIYCLLHYGHNPRKANSKNKFGYCCYNREFLCKVSGIKSSETITKAISLIRNSGELIIIYPPKPYYSKDSVIEGWHPNRYIVLNKCDQSGKYYTGRKMNYNENSLNKDRVCSNYMIINIINKNAYFGESYDPDNRFCSHKFDLENNIHHNYKLQYDWNKYGEKSFEFIKIPITEYQRSIMGGVESKAYAIYRENKLISRYKKFSKVYNVENTMNEILLDNRTMYGYNIGEMKRLHNKSKVFLSNWITKWG